MAHQSPVSPRGPTALLSANPSPIVRLQIRLGTAPPTQMEVPEGGFLIGSVPGCDWRLSGTDWPAVVCLIGCGPAGAFLRKLALTQPLQVNGQAVSMTPLVDGDRVTLRSVEILVQVQPVPGRTDRRVDSVPSFEQPTPSLVASLEARVQQLDQRQRQLEEAAQELEKDRALWYRRRDEMEQECRKQTEASTTLNCQLQQRQQELDNAQADEKKREEASRHDQEHLIQQQRELESREQLLDRRKRELEAVRLELATIRQQLYDRYQERRDRLALLQEAVNRAARKVQERKHEVDTQERQSALRQQELAALQAVLDAQAKELEQTREALAAQQRQFENQQQEAQRLMADVKSREDQLAEDRRRLEQDQSLHQADLLRLDRHKAELEQRQEQLRARALEIDERHEELQRTSLELEEQARQLDEWHGKLADQAGEIARRKQEGDAAGSQIAQRLAAVEGQQAMLATLRSRLERMRDDVHREIQLLSEQRTRQDTLEADLQQRQQESQRLRSELDHERQLLDLERQRFQERATLMESAVAQMRQAQESCSTEEERLRQQTQDLDARTAQVAEEAALVLARSDQLHDLQQRLEADRHVLRERETALTQAEQARELLQEQLRRRAEELSTRQRALTEQTRQREEALASVDALRSEIEQQRQQAEVQLAAERQQMADRVANLDREKSELAQRENTLLQRVERLKEAGRNLGAQRKAQSALRQRLANEQQETTQAAVLAQAEAGSARQEIADLKQQLSELELQAQAAVERLTRPREQLREHLAELHAYARQSYDDLETLRAQVREEAEQIRQRETALHRARDEHRLAVATFRQQLIDWQGQVAEIKRSLAQDETRLERRQAEVDEQARQVDATSARLALEAEQLQQQHRVVAERRQEVERHLEDMREWYRRKLRELAQNGEGAKQPRKALAEQRNPEAADSPADSIAPATERDILSLTSEVDPGDRQLGDLLRSLELVEADTLTALLTEARRQRRSLRQVLLASGYLTIYQMALIEAGNLDGLVLGPVRVVDRLRVTTHESVYRVFDPRRGQEAILRHLAEAELEDAVHPDEFRQRFAAAALVHHPHLAGTLEVLDVAGRPAVLQEWLSGLTSQDWPALAAAPGVWFRLLSQAALGLHTAHQSGLTHGHLQPGSVLLTSEGVLKLCGFGEPPWLVMPAPGEPDDEDMIRVHPILTGNEVAADLNALGQIAARWISASTQRKNARSKPLPEPLPDILRRLTALPEEDRYPNATVLLEDLDRAGSALPPNAEAWERLLRHVREQLAADAALRQSA